MLSQNYPNLEYMVVDGGSTDNSVEIIKKYANHLNWWTSEKDKGQSHAINKGLSRATGEIVNWINSDDYYQPGAFKTVAVTFQNPNITMATFRANVFGLQTRISRGTDIFENNLPKTLAYSRIDQPETFFRKSAVDQMGLLNESLHYCMDKEWLIRYLLLFGDRGIHQSPDIILNFRYHDDSKSVSQRDGFEKEADSIYLAYAHSVHPPAQTAILSQLGGTDSDLPTSFHISGIPSKTLQKEVPSMINYYLYKRFVEHYEKLDFDMAQTLYKHINADILAGVDRTKLETLHKRSRRFPASLIKLARKLTR